MLQQGDTAPTTVPFIDENEQQHTLADYAGKWVVVYFYPKDNTPGCTIEAEQFRDAQKEFATRNAVVLGVSKDTCASHKKFIEKKQLPFTLVADTEHALMDAFGVWGERSFMGKTYMGTSRTTFLINSEGTIAHVWETVKPAGHAKEVLAMLNALQQ
jgi:thioredoxin-dependent peroxiredoxin